MAVDHLIHPTRLVFGAQPSGQQQQTPPPQESPPAAAPGSLPNKPPAANSNRPRTCDTGST